MAFRCPDGHDSTASDFCSECGLEMPPPAPRESGPLAREPTARELCPTCDTERDDPRSPFCGVCGYNFATKQSGDVVRPTASASRPAAKPVGEASFASRDAARGAVPVVDARPPAAPPPPARPAAAAAHIEIEVTFDETKPAAPKGMPPRKFSLYDEESLLGRRSASTPQTVGLEGDDYISRRHLLIIRQRAGSYVARLFDNTNGGTQNGVEMIAGVEVPLAEGDTIAFGTFTIVKVSAIR